MSCKEEPAHATYVACSKPNATKIEKSSLPEETRIASSGECSAVEEQRDIERLYEKSWDEKVERIEQDATILENEEHASDEQAGYRATSLQEKQEEHTKQKDEESAKDEKEDPPCSSCSKVWKCPRCREARKVGKMSPFVKIWS